MNNHQHYPLFSHWYKSLNWILDKCEKMPKYVRFSISSRITALSLEILEGIIEAIYTKERKMILQRVNLALEKLRIFFRLSFDRRYISERQYQYISKELNTAGKMVGGWKKL